MVARKLLLSFRLAGFLSAFFLAGLRLAGALRRATFLRAAFFFAAFFFAMAVLLVVYRLVNEPRLKWFAFFYHANFFYSAMSA